MCVSLGVGRSAASPKAELVDTPNESIKTCVLPLPLRVPRLLLLSPSPPSLLLVGTETEAGGLTGRGRQFPVIARRESAPEDEDEDGEDVPSSGDHFHPLPLLSVHQLVAASAVETNTKTTFNSNSA